MRLSLHSLVLTPVLVAAAVVTPQHASAAVLHVPFAFTVADQNLPAGDYKVVRDSKLSVVTLVTTNQRSFNWLLAPGDPNPGDQGVIMLFDNTDSGYALRSIQYNALITRQLDKKSHQNEDRPVHVIRGE
jgi:hypothetical protein